LIRLNINGTMQDLDVDPDMPLLWVLRDAVGLTGTKYGCGKALCGCCTVYLDGEPVRSCVLPIGSVAGRSITTIEGLQSDSGKAIQAAWLALQVPQCGFCQSGQIMNAATLIEKNPSPTDSDIDQAMQGNICRCATYQRIRAGIKQAARSLADAANKS
jgi:isoquinoline 1-oxidoreductase alpha subunit